MNEPEKIATGIPGLDELLGGGVPRGLTILIAGPAGSGKSLFSTQFLVEGIKRGENGVYFSLDKRPEKLQRMALGFGWDLEKFEDEEKLGIKKTGAQSIKQFIEHMDVELIDLMAKIDAKRIVIDSISSFEMVSVDDTKKRERLYKLVDMLSGKEQTTLITTDVSQQDLNNGLYSKSGLIEFLVDGIIILDYHPDYSGDWERTISVPKMLVGKHLEKEYPLTITENGLEVTKKENKNKLIKTKGG